jgi:hypothetical protein
LNKIPVCLLFLGLFAATGCSQSLSDYLQGTSHIQCQTTDYVGTQVQNNTSQSVSVGFCSSSVAMTDSPQTLTPDSGPETLTQNIRTYDVNTEVMTGDNCEDSDVPSSNSVGSDVPVLSAADLTNNKLCYHMASITDPDDDTELYYIIPVSGTCPMGSAPFDQTTAGCVH